MDTTSVPVAPASRWTTEAGRARSRRVTRTELAAGARAMLPLIAGVAPFGLVVGVTVAGSAGPALAGWSTSVLVYGGSAQLVVVDLLAKGAAPIVVLVSVLAVQARLALYGSALTPHWRGTSLRWRALAAYLIIDPSFAVGLERYERDAAHLAAEGGRRAPAAGHVYYLGGALALWVAWQLAIVAGLTVGSVVPTGLDLEFVVPLYLIATVLPKLTTAASRAAVATAAVVAAAGTLLPLHVGLVLGIVAGIGAGLVIDGRSS